LSDAADNAVLPGFVGFAKFLADVTNPSSEFSTNLRRVAQRIADVGTSLQKTILPVAQQITATAADFQKATAPVVQQITAAIDAYHREVIQPAAPQMAAIANAVHQQVVAPLLRFSDSINQALPPGGLHGLAQRLAEIEERNREVLQVIAHRVGEVAKQRRRAEAILAMVRRQARARATPSIEIRHVTARRGRSSRAAAAGAGTGAGAGNGPAGPARQSPIDVALMYRRSEFAPAAFFVLATVR
jgi:hypothetical protein